MSWSSATSRRSRTKRRKRAFCASSVNARLVRDFREANRRTAQRREQGDRNNGVSFSEHKAVIQQPAAAQRGLPNRIDPQLHPVNDRGLRHPRAQRLPQRQGARGPHLHGSAAQGVGCQGHRR